MPSLAAIGHCRKRARTICATCPEPRRRARRSPAWVGPSRSPSGIENGDWENLGGGDGFAVGKNAPSETIDFVRFLTSAETQKKMAAAGIAVPPVVKGAEEVLTDPIIKTLWQGTADANYFQLYYDQYMPPAVGLTVNDAVQTLFAGTAPPETVAQQVETVAATELTGN